MFTAFTVYRDRRYGKGDDLLGTAKDNLLFPGETTGNGEIGYSLNHMSTLECRVVVTGRLCRHISPKLS